MKNLLLVLGLLILIANPTEAKIASQYNLDALTKKANQGDSNAQFKLGYAYLQKDAPIYDWNKGLKWWKLAANQGEIYAQNNLGSFYYKGVAVKRNLEESNKWFLMAANQNYNPAQLKLIRNYREMENFIEAYVWSIILNNSKDEEYTMKGFAVLNELSNLISKKDMDFAKEKAQLFFQERPYLIK